MPTQVQLRRGTTVQHESFTGALGEVTVNTSKKTLVVHDGSTVGGTEIAKADLSNVSTITATSAATLTTARNIGGVRRLRDAYFRCHPDGRDDLYAAGPVRVSYSETSRIAEKTTYSRQQGE